MPSPYVDHVLTDEQINEFAERGFVLFRRWCRATY
jgi:hypothetical protein